MMVEEKQQLGRYELLAEIGRGAMGRVYKARDPLIDRVLAIKTVDFRLMGANEPEGQARFFSEARSAGRLNHSNIVTIYDAGRANGRAYIAMELLEGLSLRETLDHHAPQPLALLRALEIAGQIARGLAYAHEHGVIHRDVKPANVILVGSKVKITDFGIARMPFNTTIAGELVGSPKYMSPEQARGDSVDGRSDLFSLGAMMYEMLSGKPAFSGKGVVEIMRAVHHSHPPRLSSVNPKVPAEVENIVQRLLAKEPADRYPSARVLLRDLATAVKANGGRSTRRKEPSARSDKGETTVVLQPKVKGASKSRTRVWPYAAVAGVAMVGAAVAFWPKDVTVEHETVAAVQQPSPIAPPVPAESLPPAPVVATEPEPPPAASSTPEAAAVPSAPVKTARVRKPKAEVAAAPAAVVEPGIISIAVAPWGEVFINGEPRGVSPPTTQFSVPPGRHRVEIRNGALPSHAVEVTIASGDTRRIKHRFE